MQTRTPCRAAVGAACWLASAAAASLYGPPAFAAEPPPSTESATEADSAGSKPTAASGEAKAGGKVGTSGEAKGSGSADAPGPASSTSGDVPSGRRYSARGKTIDRDRWIHRWAPDNNMAEFGAYGGVWFPSPRIELFRSDRSLPDNGFQRYNTAAPDIGLRAGYYPFRFFGIEAEGAIIPTRLQQSGTRATVWTLRGQLVAQLGLWSITPFLAAGAGMLGVSSPDGPEGVGSEQDVIIHFGGGAKFYINRWVMLRLDIRNVVSNRRGVGEGLASSPEILLGLSVTLGRKKQRKARPGLGDRDGDRVLDNEDYCPDVYGAPPRGCPTVCIDDNDGDGLENPKDKCPEQPESRNGFEDDDGCPDEVPPELNDLAGVMEGITFDTDKDTIKSKSKPILDHAIEIMQRFPTIKVEIDGHTDSQGGYRHNVDLSKRRAESVKRYLVEHGISEDRMTTRGAGPDEPIDTNETAEGRARNRRIEFKILEQ